jgi:hypothetical protein
MTPAQAFGMRSNSTKNRSNGGAKTLTTSVRFVPCKLAK